MNYYVNKNIFDITNKYRVMIDYYVRFRDVNIETIKKHKAILR